MPDSVAGKHADVHVGHTGYQRLEAVKLVAYRLEELICFEISSGDLPAAYVETPG